MAAGIIYHKPNGSCRTGEIAAVDTVYFSRQEDALPDENNVRLLGHCGGTVHHNGLVYDFSPDESVCITDDRIVISPLNPNKVDTQCQ